MVIRSKKYIFRAPSYNPLTGFYDGENAKYPTYSEAKSFKTISIDMFAVRDGKLATAYHVENWVAAMKQIK